jgi:hypothetical protein
VPTKKEVSALLSRVEAGVKDASVYCFMARGKELQEEQRDGVIALAREVSDFKQLCIDDADEDSANVCLSAENLLACMSEELTMWIDLKNDEPNSAWNHLINAQSALEASLAAHDVAAEFAAYAEHLSDLEEVLFPSQVFMSPGMIISSARCSICESDYDDCEHIAGRAYMGRFCTRVIHSIQAVDEVSIVQSPFDKRARVERFSDGSVTKDQMTLRVVSDDD